MSSVKEEAKKLIEELPETVTWSDILYQLYVREKVAKGIEQANRGELIPQEDVEKEFGL